MLREENLRAGESPSKWFAKPPFSSPTRKRGTASNCRHQNRREAIRAGAGADFKNSSGRRQRLAADSVREIRSEAKEPPSEGDALRGAGVQAEFARRLEEGTAAGLLAEEALDPGSIPILIGALREQPAWSDFPVVLMTSQRGPGDALAGLSEDTFNITLLERPVRMQTLISVLQGALRQRRRQYDLRNQLAEQQQTEQRLRQTQKLESLGVFRRRGARFQ